MTKKSPRQIAGDVIQSLAELTAHTPALRRLTVDGVTIGAPEEKRMPLSRALQMAFFMRTPMPSPRVPPRGEWRAILAAAQYTADVMACATESRAAWTAAAEASYWLGAAQGLLHHDAVKWRADALLSTRKERKVKVEAEKRKAAGRQGGTETTRNKKAARRQRARQLYEAGKPWKDAQGKRGMDVAAEVIRKQIGGSFKTVRGYLTGA